MEETIVILRHDQVVPWPGLNPRTHFDPERQAELEASVRARGIRQPLLVHDRGVVDAGDVRYWIVAGERRWRAAAAAEAAVPCLIGVYSEEEAIEIALLENLQRADMTVLEEARGLRRLLEAKKLTQQTLAGRFGKSQAWISNRVRLLDLPSEVLALIDEGLLDPSTARDYLLPFRAIPEAKREKLYARAANVIREAAQGEPIGGREVERVVGRIAVDLSRTVYAEERVHGKG